MTVTAVHRFASLDPWENLAREELWLDNLPAGDCGLLLYVNSPCVVMGKHQNPLREVRLTEASRRGVPLIRRSSGGGTVWHDEGNLNWSFLVPKEDYERTRVPAALVQALATLGLAVRVGEKGDLFLGEHKVSGSASLVRRDRILHHGTLLCRARLSDLHGVLGPTGTLVEWVGVASRPMPVTNLEIPVERAAEALISALGPPGSLGSGLGTHRFEEQVVERAAFLRSRAWLWDQTPPFTWEGATRRGWARFRVRDGLIEEVFEAEDKNLSTIVGKRFFDSTLHEYIPQEAL